MKIVIDTNVLISGVFFGGFPKKILNLWLEKVAFEVIVSKEIVDEYHEVLKRFDEKKGSNMADELTNVICSVAKMIDVHSNENYSRDIDDDKFINCAVDGDAIYVVSGDNDLLVLKSVKNIQIVTASDFLKRIKLV